MTQKDCQFHAPTEVGNHEYKMRLVTVAVEVLSSTVNGWVQVKSGQELNWSMVLPGIGQEGKSDCKGLGIRPGTTSKQLMGVECKQSRGRKGQILERQEIVTGRDSTSWDWMLAGLRVLQKVAWKDIQQVKVGCTEWPGLGYSYAISDWGWDGWMASLTQWTWVWASSRSWWWTEKPGVLQSMGSQRVRYNWATELNWSD